MTTVFVGDTGTEIILDCGVDVSTATVRKIRAKRPDGHIKEWVATANSVMSIKYVLVDGDISVEGEWQLQAYIEMPGWKGRGAWATLKVMK
jgi:hypothetical protein